ncbi:MAG: 30S ribosomal protein S20 [Bacteriovoracaceae bacterium]|nr:30S ribosomal protein S20 [Bacteriovoracaceae bacterium]
MANHKSAKKRVRQTEVRTERNKTRRSITRNLVKKIREAISKKDQKTAIDLLPKTQSMLQKAAQTGAIEKNCASKKVSRLATQVQNLSK